MFTHVWAAATGCPLPPPLLPPEGYSMDCFDLWLRFVAVADFFVVVVAAAATGSLQLDF